MPAISFVTERFSEWLREQRKGCVIAGYFPVIGPSFDENVPWDVQVLDEVTSVYVRRGLLEKDQRRSEDKKRRLSQSSDSVQ